MSTPITITGRIGNVADPLTYTSSGKARLTVSVAESRRVRQDDGTWVDGPTSWHRVTAWGPLAEAVAETGLVKGLEVVIVGDLAERSWTKQDGSEGRAWEVTARTFAFPASARQHVTVRKVSRTEAAPTPVEQYPVDDPWAVAR